MAHSSSSPKFFSDEEIDKLAATYHAWRGEKEAGEYRDVPGFCKSATTEEIREHGYVLTPDITLERLPSLPGAPVQTEAALEPGDARLDAGPETPKLLVDIRAAATSLRSPAPASWRSTRP
jgi:type I restriction-modification system DNA methylase subunit